MTLLGFASVLSRRTVVTLALVAGLGVAQADRFGLSTPVSAQAAAAPQEADPFKFSSDAAVMLFTVKPESVGDFESMWTAIRTKLAASDKPELKQLGESLKIYKIAGPVPPTGQVYFFIADPASKTTSYGLSPFLLFTSNLFPRAEGEALFAKVNSAMSDINAIGLTKVP